MKRQSKSSQLFDLYFAEVQEYMKVKESNERLMRFVEFNSGIPEQGAHDYRQFLINVYAQIDCEVFDLKCFTNAANYDDYNSYKALCTGLRRCIIKGWNKDWTNQDYMKFNGN